MKSRRLLVAGLLLGAVFLPAANVQAVEKDGSRLGSVGLQVVPTATGELVVLQVPSGTSAAVAGVRPGDLIVRIGDFTLAGSDFADVVAKHLWGPEGSQVIVHYLRPGESGRKSTILRRGALDPKLTVTPAVHNGAGQPKPGVNK